MKYSFLLFLLLGTVSLHAQWKMKVQVKDDDTHKGIDNVTITANHVLLAYTDSAGIAVLQMKQPQALTFLRINYKAKTVNVSAKDTLLLVELEPEAEALEEVTVVASTRNNEKIENSPIKIEVLGKEEMSEEAGIKPGNIASILGDVSGVQIQQSSAVSGNSNVRIQGLDGRYTQILRDGMPLYDGFSGGFGILTIPPLDLQQIELLKGSSSTLYGGGAIGGMINLISKKPSFKQEADVLLNVTTLNEFNVNAYVAKRNKKAGYNLFSGYTRQGARDVDGDGLSDLPDANSFVVHPKVFYYPSERTTLSLGYTGTFDNRKGGDMEVLKGFADNTHQYFEKNVTARHTGEFLLEHYYPHDAKLSVKGSVSDFSRNTHTNMYRVDGRQTSYYGEVSLYQPFGTSNLVAGVNVAGDAYRTSFPDTAYLRGFSNFTAGVFAQFSWHITEETILESGLRADHHNDYGTFVLPRVAFFHRFSEHWATRLGFGMGYKTPNPLAPQNIDYSVLDLMGLNRFVKPEQSYGYNAEVNYKKEWSARRKLFINQAFFLTQVDKPVVFQENAAGKVDLINAGKPVSSKGFDTYVKANVDGWELYVGYTFTDVKRKYLPDSSFMPLTPKHRFAFVVVKELGETWRFGLEGSLTGRQFRYDGTTTPSYFFSAVMIQRNFGKHFSLVLNCENVLDYRMSREEKIFTGPITNPSFKPLWAPIDGRVANLSLRWKL